MENFWHEEEEYSDLWKGNGKREDGGNKSIEVQRSWSVVLIPEIGEFLVSSEFSAYSEKTSWNFLNIEAGGGPGKGQIISSVVSDLNHNFCFNAFVVPDGQVQVGHVASSVESPLVAGNFIGWDVEGIAGGEGDVFIFRGMVDGILPDELKRAVGWVFLEDPDCAFGQGDTQFVVFGVGEFNFIAGFSVLFIPSPRVQVDQVVFSNWNSVGFGNELHLLLGVVVQGYRFAESVHVEIWEGFLREGGRGSWSFSSKSHIWAWSRKGNSAVIADNIDITRDEFEFGIFIHFSTPVVNGDPTSNISFFFSLVQHNRIVRFPLESGGPVCDLAVGGDGLLTKDLPVEGGFGEETRRQLGQFNPINIAVDFNSVAGFDDVAAVVAQEDAWDSDGSLPQFDPEVDFLLNVFLHDGSGVDEVGLVVLLKHLDALRVFDGLEGDGLSLDVGGDISEVEIASALVEGDGAGIFNHGESVVVNGDRKGHGVVDGWAIGLLDFRDHQE